MNSSYKLLGLLWDRAPASAEVRIRRRESKAFPSYTSPTNLFDLIEGKRRSIPLSVILSQECKRDLDDLFGSLDDCFELEIVRDIGLASENNVMRAFLEKKEAQICQYASWRLPDTTVVIVWPPCLRQERSA